MRAISRVLALLLLVSGLASAQGVPGALSPCKMDGSDCAPATGTVTTTGTLASGQVALGSGATSITGDAGLTGVGTGTGFTLSLWGDTTIFRAGTNSPGFAFGGVYSTFHLGKIALYESVGSPTFLSTPSAGTLLVEDGSGNPRDVQARTGTFGTSVVTPAVASPSGGYAYLISSSGNIAGWGDGDPNFYTSFPIVLGIGAINNLPTVIRSATTATLALGALDSATPIAQTFQSQGSRGGTDTNVAGGNLTIRPGAGTGSATGSSIVFQTPSAGASGTTAQTQTTRLTLSEPAVIAAVPVRLAGYTVATLPAGTVGDTAYVTDATAPTYLGTLTGGGAVTCPVMYNGAAWVSH